MVRFTQPGEFNDPFELRPHITGLADEDAIARQHAIAFRQDSLDQLIRKSLDKFPPRDRSKIDPAQLLSHLQNGAGGVRQFVTMISNGLGAALSRQVFNTFNENLGIFCLTEDPLNLLMWAHYGDHHRGVVVEFDDEHEFFSRRKGSNDDLRHFRRVSYSDVRFSDFLTRSTAIQVFYTKSREWEYEREWRLIVPLADATTVDRSISTVPVALFEVPDEAVLGVFTGCRIGHTASYAMARSISARESLRQVVFSRVECDEAHFALRRFSVSRESIDSWLAMAADGHMN